VTSETRSAGADAGAIRAATPAEIEGVWRTRWGLPIVTLGGRYQPADVSGLVAVDHSGEIAGLVTWAVAGDAAEIVSLDALAQGRGVGSALLGRAEAAVAALGARRVWLQTTNDNLRALRFYVERGYRLVGVHLDAMDAVRRVKPEVPARGMDGIPLRDAWELEKPLATR